MARPTSPPIHIPSSQTLDDNLIDLSTPSATPSDDFGAFVSSDVSVNPTPVPTPAPPVWDAFDPLSALQPEPTHARSDPVSRTRSRDPSSSSSSYGAGASTDFFAGATQRSQQNRANVLDELLAHEDEPMYWVDRSKEAHYVEDGLREGIHTPLFEAPPTIAVTHPEPAVVRLPVVSPPGAVDDDAVSPPPSPPTPFDTPLPNTRTASTSPERRNRPRTRKSSSASSPPPTSAQSPPLATLGRKWMSTLLSNVPGAVAADGGDVATPSFAPGMHRQDSLAMLNETMRHSPPSHNSNLSHSQSHSQSPRPRPSVLVSASAVTSHGTPFAYKPYVPPSGAPSFTGDRTWDKGFEYDAPQDDVPVVLSGRTPATAHVLEPTIAAKIRPSLPALQRLQNRWTLLYSLDQHGISLGTLYKRCAPPPGMEDSPRPTLLVVRDAEDGLFGVYIAEGIRFGIGGGGGSGMGLGAVFSGAAASGASGIGGGRRGFYGSGEA